MNTTQVGVKVKWTPKRRMSRTTIELKKEIVEKYDAGLRVADLSARYAMPRSTISTILKRREAIMGADVAKGVTVLTKQRSRALEEVEKVLAVWVSERQSRGEPAGDLVICQKARQLYEDITRRNPGLSAEGETFKASRGWCENFKKRSDIDRAVSVHLNRFTNSKLEGDQDNTLIAAIEPHRCLYDPGHEGYHDAELKKTEWKNVAINLGLPVSKVKARWNILERSYRVGIKSAQRLPLFGKMSFLKPHLPPESEDQCASTDRGSISIKSEVLSSDDEFADTFEASPSDIGAARSHMTEAYKSTRVSVASLEEKESHEDLDMKVDEEVLEDRQGLLAANSSSFQMLLSDQSSAGNKIQNSSQKKSKARRIFTKFDEGRVDSDLEYFKGFLSLIKELSAKRKRQLFASFAQMLFQHLEEQESEEADSNEMF